jgi:hypothetical protein
MVDTLYGPSSPTAMLVPTSKVHSDADDTIDNGGDDSPVYSTTTDMLSESGSFLVPSSVPRYMPPAPKPRYSTLSFMRVPLDQLEQMPLPKPRSRSNSRTRSNNVQPDESPYFRDERPASSSDSGIGQLDAQCLPNSDVIRSSLTQTAQNALEKHQSTSSYIPQQVKHQTLTSSTAARGTEC